MSNINSIMNYLADNLEVTSDITQQEEAELLEKLAPLGSVDIKEKIREVMAEEMPRWRFIGQGDGGAIVSLPDDGSYSEIYVNAFFGLNPQWTFKFHLLEEEIPHTESASGAGTINGSYNGNNSTDTHVVSILVTKKQVRMFTWVWGTTNCTSSSYIRVYVR